MDFSEKIHCLNITAFNITSVYLVNKTESCVTCFFPQNCLSNNQCLNGTTGLTCEVCDQSSPDSKYFLFGNSCIPCEDFPWSALVFGVLILISVGCVFLTGFTQQLCTKLKIITHFFQLLILSVHVKTQWPELVMWFISTIGFGSFTASIAKTRCLISNTIYKFYLEWLTAIGIPTIIIMLGYILTKRQQTKVKKRDDVNADEKILKRMSRLRRFLFFVAVAYYMPVTMSVIHSSSCTSSFGAGMVFRLTVEDIFIYDNSQVCDSFIFQTFQLLLNVYMIVCVIFFPLFLILFTLRQKKWKLLEAKQNEYGFMYESYKKSWCFWEAIPMLRKMISLGITDTLLTHPFYQSLSLLSLTGFYVFLLILLRPYKKYYWKSRSVNNHVVLDIVTNIGIGILQAGGLLLTINLYELYMNYIIIIVIGVVIVFWIITMLLSKCEQQTVVIVEITRSEENTRETGQERREENIQLQQITSKKSVAFNIKKNKVSHDSESFDF